MNEQKIMRCPFRKDGEGFAPCYGKECMAYCEYEQPALSYPLHRKGKDEEAQKFHIITCRMMPVQTICAGGCAT